MGLVLTDPHWALVIDAVRHQQRKFAIGGSPLEYALAHLRITEDERDQAIKRADRLQRELDEITRQEKFDSDA